MPWSSISSSASVPGRSAATVHAGALITSDSGVSGPAPAATTRVRMSRSVTMPSVSPRSTTTHVTPRLDHPPRRVLHPGLGRADERPGADQLADRPVAAGGGVAVLPGEQAHALGHRAGEEARRRRPLEHRPDRRAPGSGRRGCPRPRARRSRAAPPRAARQSRTSRPRRAGRAAGRRSGARPTRGAPRRRTRRWPRRSRDRVACRRGTRSRRSPRRWRASPRRACRTADGGAGTRRCRAWRAADPAIGRADSAADISLLTRGPRRARYSRRSRPSDEGG